MMDYETLWRQELTSLQERDQWRSLTSYTFKRPTVISEDGRDYLLMASNNYLGLTYHPLVQSMVKDAVYHYGSGSGGSRLLSGNMDLYTWLESDLSDWKGSEASLVFSSGYAANVGTISALVGKGDIIFSDALNHASIIDGCRLSGAQVVPYAHNDMNDLEGKLQAHLGKQSSRREVEDVLHGAMTTAEGDSVSGRIQKVLIVTDGVFSMDGDIAPIRDLVTLKERYGALLYVDDAHATGVIGGGKGTASHGDVSGRVDIQMGTLSKALGSVGGFVAGSSTLIEYLVNKSRSLIFSTALTPMDLNAARGALQVLRDDPTVYESLRHNCAYMATLLQGIGVPATDDTPIFPVVVGSNERAMAIAKALRQEGIVLSAVRPPTVPVGESRLRLTVTAAHKEADMQRVAEALGRLL